ncbi:MAG: glycoside hydrolase family 127 protein, partial [Lentisphaeria bacterium]|nr:glycoside hydrolase family 127 protein [Lentisphaeria bacterium]
LTGGGSKVAAVDQIDFCFHTPFGGNDCCRAQGPEGLALSPRLALMRAGEDSLYLNFYEPLTARIPDLAEIEVKGNYPLEPKTRILVKSEKPFALNLRIPSFLKEATLNGTKLDTEADCWLTLNRQWKEEDVLELDFDLSVREVTSPDGHYTAFLRGPLLLAEDSRGDVPHALCHEAVKGRDLIDYITAGDEMRKENTLTVWFPKEK